MNLSDIKQWIVSADKLARPINPFDYDSTVEYTAYERFASFTQQHTFATDLEPGIYDGDKVEVICKHLSGIEWHYENTGREIKKSIAINVELRLKQEPKEQSEDLDKLKNQPEPDWDKNAIDKMNALLNMPQIQPLNPNANAIKVIESEIERWTAIKNDHINGWKHDIFDAKIEQCNDILKLLQS